MFWSGSYFHGNREPLYSFVLSHYPTRNRFALSLEMLLVSRMMPPAGRRKGRNKKPPTGRHIHLARVYWRSREKCQSKRNTMMPILSAWVDEYRPGARHGSRNGIKEKPSFSPKLGKTMKMEKARRPVPCHGVIRYCSFSAKKSYISCGGPGHPDRYGICAWSNPGAEMDSDQHIRQSNDFIRRRMGTAQQRTVPAAR